MTTPSSSHTVFFDLETGGLQDDHPDIQLGAVAIDLDTGREIDSFEAKIKFDESLCDPEALRLNSYEREVWEREALEEREVVHWFSRFLLRKSAVIERFSKRTGNPYYVARLAGHNAARFDGPRLKRLFERHDAFLPASYLVLDTMQLALWTFAGLTNGKTPDNLKLETLAAHLGIATAQRHDALADALTSARVACRLLAGDR